MGGKNSKGDASTTGSSSSSSSSSASASSNTPLQPNSVLLNVYKPRDSASPVGMVYHSGIVLYDTEYMFAQGVSSVCGIVEHRPKHLSDDAQWVFRETLRLGDTDRSRQEVRAMMAEMKSGGEWPGNGYHVTKRNCNHFSEAVAKKLGMVVPSWVNRGARIASTLGMGGSGKQQLDLEGRPLKPEDAAALVLTTPEDVCVDALLDLKGLAVLGAQPTQSLASIIPVDAKGGRVQLKSSVVVSSDSDEQLLLFLPFTKSLSLRSILLRLSVKDPQSNPHLIKLFADRRNMDFSDVDEVVPTATWTIPKFDRTPTKQESKDGLYEAVLQLSAAKWRSVAHVTIFVESNHGAAHTKIHGLTLVGRDK